MNDRVYIAIDLKSFYASVECADRKLDPLTTNLVVADQSRTDKTICLAVSPALFLPLSWNISLPGETVPAEHRLVAVPEGGYLTTALPRRAFPVKEGDTLFRLHSPQLETGIERLQSVLKYDRTLCDLQQLDEKLFSESRVTAEKIESDRTALRELLRRREVLTVRSTMSGTFVPKLPSLSKQAFLPKGTLVGEVVSAKLMVYAYAQDRDIGKLKPGAEATVYLRDSLAGLPARITVVNRIATQLKDTPLLQHYGGPIPVYLSDGGDQSYTSVLPLYRIELEFTAPADIASGRVVTVKIRHSERLGEQLWKLILSALRKEL